MEDHPMEIVHAYVESSGEEDNAEIEGGSRNQENENNIFKDFLKSKPNSNSETHKFMAALAEKCSALEKKVVKIETEKNKDLFDMITYQAKEIVRKDERISQLEEELAKKDGLIRKMRRGGQQMMARSPLSQTPAGTAKVPVKSVEKMPALRAAEKPGDQDALRETEEDGHQSQGSGTWALSEKILRVVKKEVEEGQRTTRRSSRLNEAVNLNLGAQMVEVEGEETPLRVQGGRNEERPLKRKSSLDKPAPSENKENEEVAQRRNTKPSKRTPEKRAKETDAVEDAPPSLSKVKRLRVGLHLHDKDDQPPILLPETAVMADQDDKAADGIEEILLASQWLRENIVFKQEDGQLYSSMTEQALSPRQKELALERCVLLLPIHSRIIPVAMWIFLTGWAQESVPAEDEVAAALRRLSDAGILDDNAGVFEKKKMADDMMAFQRSLAERGLRLEEYLAHLAVKPPSSAQINV